MADLRCPKCNSLNPGDAEKCWNCDAPLLSDENSSESAGGSFDWLSELRNGSDSDPGNIDNEPEAVSSDEEDLPDWLKRVRQRSESEKPEPDFSDTEASSDDLPDWLMDLQSEPLGETSASPSEEDTIPPPVGGVESQDWFQSLSEFSSEKTPDAEDEGVPEWLLEDVEETQPVIPPTPMDDTAAFSATELPDWFAETEKEVSDTPTEETAAFKAEDLPDWLSETPVEDEPETPAEDEPETPVVEGGETAVYRPGEDLPDWLLESVEVTQPAVQPTQADETILLDAEDLPDWLSESGETVVTPAAPSAEEELPSWLLSDDEPEVQEVQEVQEASEEEQIGEAILPEADKSWFEILGAGAVSASLPESELPETELPQEEPQIEQESVELPSDEEVEPVEPEITLPVEADELDTPESEEDLSVTAFEIEELPDWLSEESVDLPQPEPSASTPAFILDEDDELEEPVIEQIHPFSEEDIPAWLTAEEELTSEEDESEDLTRTTLPNWVEAMRPVETVALGSAAGAASNEEVRTEKAGPLAGLTGILPAEGTAIEYGRPPTYSMRLRVTDKQRASAALLETVLEEENKAREIQREKTGASQAILRLLVGILLITVIILSGGLTNVGSQPVNMNSVSFIRFNQQLDSLPINGTVLLAADFEPGYSHEITLAGQGIIDRLLSRENKLVLVSTSLAGPVLAEEMVLRAGGNGSLAGDRITNLGFLPGGIISMKEFSLAPQAAAQYGMDWVRTGQSAWQHPALQDVQQISDFSLVLVMTDSGDTGRMWLEQIKPHLGGVPILMITTAQAAPILNPYVASGQLDGLISGLSGGKASVAQPVAQMESSWTAFRVGILVTVALILIGILFRGISSLFPGSKV